MYTSYELTAINIVTRNSNIHTYPITGICPWNNTPVTLHMSIALHVYYTEHIDATLLHILYNKQNSSFNLIYNTIDM